MNLHTVKWSKFILYIGGGGLSAVFGFLAIVNPKNSVAWIGAGAAIVGLAGAIGTMLPTPSPYVPQDAKIVDPSGTPTGATVVSTSSELLPANQQAKGPS